jgi:hypothetical protein
MLDTLELGNSLREIIRRRSWDELRERIRERAILRGTLL